MENLSEEVGESESDTSQVVTVASPTNGLTAAAATSGTQDPNHVVELYDSGITHHLSPYCDCFASFKPILPKGFDAVNQQSFSAMGIGDMLVEVPNGTDVSTIRLTEVLYSPEIGYTLVSIGRIDDTGCITTFGKDPKDWVWPVQSCT
ncbi:hypothetical protein ID866_11333 [Astraeus odoratus]|nr:hypothetical protein ID866_11333 [Astraeus odoratus]